MPSGGNKTGTVKFEIPRRACPGYIRPYLGDRTGENTSVPPSEIPPGHRFLVYFHGMADKGEARYLVGDKAKRDALNKAKERGDWPALKRDDAQLTKIWVPLKDASRIALEQAAGMGEAAEALLEAWNDRADETVPDHVWVQQAELVAPLATGLGNPHPVENGFAFLSPYGVPYIAGSGVKGVLRRAAEELALFDERSKWSLSLVWVLFGFDENSAWYRNGHANATWHKAYREWVAGLSARPDECLSRWVEAVRHQAPERYRDLPADEFARALHESADLRRSIHWQGLVVFWDAVPRKGARMGVDVLNPHHWNYYRGIQGATPHDAENPKPVFFLVLQPGARFTFRAHLLPGRSELCQAVEQARWHQLLDEAFRQACEFWGFGAKGTVGYGHMEVDSEGAARWRREREERRREKELALYPWRAHLPDLERAADWGTFRQTVEQRLKPHLGEREVAEAVERKAGELARRKWSRERDELVAGWLAEAGLTWTPRHAEGDSEPESEDERRIDALADWGAWQASGLRIEDLSRPALRKLREKLREWGCNKRRAKPEKRRAWQQVERMLRN